MSPERWGLVVEDAASYPIRRLWGGEAGSISVETHVHTSQREVNIRLVEVKAGILARGEYAGGVEVALVEGKVWMVDGHHTLCAYRELGLEAPATYYSLGGRDWIAAPRYGDYGDHPLWRETERAQARSTPEREEDAQV